VTYVEDTLYNSGGIVIVSFDLTMYQGNTVVTVSDSLTIDSDSLIMLDVAIYCDQFKSTFQGRRIVYLRGAPDHHFNQPEDLAVANLQELDYVLYPNPASDILQITFQEEINGEIFIYDATGKLNFNEKISGEKFFNCDVSNLSKGIYFLQVQTNSAASRTKFSVR
jgi:hypothetical protein